MKPSKRSNDIYFSWWQALLFHHKQAFQLSIQRLLKEPLASLMIVTIIAIALALPTTLLLLLEKAQQFSQEWQKQSQITLYLQQNLSENQVQQLQQQLRANPNIAEVKRITPEQGLEQLQQHIGLEHLNQFLSNNPLPNVLTLTPAVSQQNTQAMRALQQQFVGLPEVKLVQLDDEWLQRWYSLLDILNKTTIFLASIFALGVILAIGNAVRLTTERYRKQIDLLQLLGATRHYVKRPFVYAGILYGIGGALIAWLLLQIAIICLHNAVDQFVQSYNPDWHLTLIGFGTLLSLLFFGLSLGWLGSLISLRKYLD